MTVKINKNGLMSFGEAMILLMEGYTVSRFTLNYSFYYKLNPHYYNNGYNVIPPPAVFKDFTHEDEDGVPFANLVTVFSKREDGGENVADNPFNIQDVMANDWIVYEPNMKL